MGEYLTYLKKFQLALFIVILSIASVVFLVTHTFPEFQKITDIQKNYKNQTKSLADAEQRLASLNETLEKEKAQDSEIVKAFFKPAASSEDNEAAISEEFEEILQLLRENKIKTRTLKFEPEPKDDQFVQHVFDRYYVSKVTADMIATYTDFENFLRDLYKHEHFLEISRIEIKPYDRNKRILLINFQLKLYAQKVGSSMPMPANNFAPQESAPNNNPAQNVQAPQPPQVPQGPQVPKPPAQNNDDQQGADMTRINPMYSDKAR